jgi:hypothetical protein
MSRENPHRMEPAIVNEPTVAARFSPGRWWGFNGVDDLELSNGVLTRTHSHIFGGRTPKSFDIGSVQLVSQEIRVSKSGRRNWLRMIISIDGSTKVFTGHVEDGQPFAAVLSRMTTRN